MMPARCSLDKAVAWIDAATMPLAPETVALDAAAARVLAEDVHAIEPIPPAHRAALDGFAVRAEATLGAGAYNPLPLPLIQVAAGDTMPDNTDAVIPLDLAQPGTAAIECVEPVAAGANVEARGAVAAARMLLVTAGTRLAARHLGLFSNAGIPHVSVYREPRSRIVTVRPIAGADSNTPMIRAAAERDGALVSDTTAVDRDRTAIAAALGDPGADIMLVIGGTGAGINDHAAEALADTGEIAIHGIALQPGKTAGLGRTRHGVPVVLLPGPPAACLFAYELLGGRAIRRLSGRGAALPYARRIMTAARKIVSAIGMTEICPVRRTATDIVEPLPSFPEIGLMAAVLGDGFLIVPEGREGYPPGAAVDVYLYERG